MTDKIKGAYEKLRSNADDILKSDATKQAKDSFLKAVEDKTKLMHDMVSKAGKEFTEISMEAFEKHSTEEAETKQKEEQSGNFKDRIANLISELDNAMKKTEVFSDAIKEINEGKLEKIINIKKNDVTFKLKKKMAKLANNELLAKCCFLAEEKQPKPETLELSDNGASITIKVTNGCRNFFIVDQELDRSMNAKITFTVNADPTDKKLYFGILNENIKLKDECFCSDIANAGYFYMNGWTTEFKKTSDTQDLNYMGLKNTDVKITITFSGVEGNYSLQLNDNPVKTFKLTGNTFKFAAGACEKCTGTITIEDYEEF